MAPKGNQFWKLRSKHGRKPQFASPLLLWEAAAEYFNWLDEHPWYRVEVIRGGALSGQLIEIPVARPYTLSGLCLHLHCSQSFLREFKRDCSEDFVSVIRQIEDICYVQKFEGAVVGIFNANIIARDLCLANRQDVVSTGRITNQLPNVIVQPVKHSTIPVMEIEE